ncbi:MAG: hypothetical protein IJU98_01610 [Synergistaceae bacterium]|nr:hypothetical protein [Synergistaceae bacterium]
MEVLQESWEETQVAGDGQTDYALVIEGYYQAMQGRTKNFNSVCDRLAGKYLDAAI